MASTNFFPTLYQEYIYKSRYARWLPDKNRREDWNETVDRLFTFFDEHLQEFHNFSIEKSIRQELYDAVLNQDVMPSMRCLMTAGEALRRDNIAGYNCSYTAVDSPRAFDEILYVLMNGCFHEDTLIKTKLGNKKINEITSADEVLSYDIENSKFEWIPPEWVIPTEHSKEKAKIRLEFEDGSVINCTEDHEFFTTNRGWVQAKELLESDDIKNYHEISN